MESSPIPMRPVCHRQPSLSGRPRRLGRASAASLFALVTAACGAHHTKPEPPDPPSPSKAPAYTLFEADPVRPVAVLENSGLVAVTNTFDDYLELLRPVGAGLEACGAVAVGLRPVAVAVIDEDGEHAELWVVNHLSDSVSVIHVDTEQCRGEVTKTLQVGDEPRDVVVTKTSAGEPRVFVTSAHRGQQHALLGARTAVDLVTPPSEKEQRGLADVFVFDPQAPNVPLSVINLFGDTPRALAVGPHAVYAAGFHTGNRTTGIPAETAVAVGLESLQSLLARDETDAFIERDGELVLKPESRTQKLRGGSPAVVGSGRCLPDPRIPVDPGTPTLQQVCVATDAEQHPERVLLQTAGTVTPNCQCTSGNGTVQPTTGVIVKFFETAAECGSAFTTFPDGTHGCWLDSAPEGVSTPASQAALQAPPMAWNSTVKFSLPDRDVFEIDPDTLTVQQSFAGVGTIVFGLAVNPQSGDVFATNTDAHNLTRFEGHGKQASTTVIGHLHESRITRIAPNALGVAEASSVVTPIHLNTHIDYSRCCARVADENEKSFAFPTAGVFSADGSTFYFTALGSDKLGIVETPALDAQFDHDRARRAQQLREIQFNEDVVEPAGPVGLALDTIRSRLYVKTHFSNELVVIDPASEAITARVSLHSPEPERIRRGRPFLYNARLTSAHGDSACASCHVFGNFDSLAWDLGDPDGTTVNNPGPFANVALDEADFRSNKGPMTTQTLSGMDNHGPMHWRGDRVRKAQQSPGAQPDVGSLNEHTSFGEFDVAIAGLNGNDQELDPALFTRFTDFALALALPPNPIRNLDNSLTADQNAARALYFGCSGLSDAQFDARECRGSDGSLVRIDVATAECTCANNPFVAGLHDSPVVQNSVACLQSALSDAELRAAVQSAAAQTSGEPTGSNAEELGASIDELLGADTQLTALHLLPEGLTGATLRLARAVLRLPVPARDAVLSVLAERLPTFGCTREDRTTSLNTVDEVAGFLNGVGQFSAFNQFLLEDEKVRNTADFRNLRGGCDMSAELKCNLRVHDGTTCHGCHTLDPRGNAQFNVENPGFFGTSGEYSNEGESQVFKVPHLRNMYQKVGRFGDPPNPFFHGESVLGARKGGYLAADTQYMGEQVRGFGFFHDGIVDTLHRFHGARAFVADENNPGGLDPVFPRESDRAACVALFRHAPADALLAAPAELQPRLAACTGPLPESCFGAPQGDECQVALQQVGSAEGVPDLPEIFEREVLPFCFQLGSVLEGGTADGVCYPNGLRERAEMEAFMLAFDSNLKPMVGQQLTLTDARSADSLDADPDLARLLREASRGHCDLAAHSGDRGLLVVTARPERASQSLLQDADGNQRSLAALTREADPLTLTCYPPRPDLAEARRVAFGR
jgi:YVTN family beta-propeller protein